MTQRLLVLSIIAILLTLVGSAGMSFAKSTAEFVNETNARTSITQDVAAG